MLVSASCREALTLLNRRALPDGLDLSKKFLAPCLCSLPEEPVKKGLAGLSKAQAARILVACSLLAKCRRRWGRAPEATWGRYLRGMQKALQGEEVSEQGCGGLRVKKMPEIHGNLMKSDEI